MDPLSITAGAVGVLDAVTKLSATISRFKQDYELADEDADVAWNHAVLLRQEIIAVQSAKSNAPSFSPSRKGRGGFDRAAEASFDKAISTACGLFSEIEASLPLRSGPHTWRSRLAWVRKLKKVLGRLKERLQSAESTLQGIVRLEQLYVSRDIQESRIGVEPYSFADCDTLF